MLLRHIYNDQLAQASYLVGSQETGEALVVDPNRDIDQYITLAEQDGLRISAVTETHIHADFVSGTRELAAKTGATLYLSDAGPDEWKYTFAEEAGAVLLHDGDTFAVGTIRIDVLHTPGHTPEHLSFLVTDTASADEPMGVFTGDFIFVGDVGRPDLLETAAGMVGTMDGAARQLFHSIQRFRTLPAYLQIWPGHGAGSACGRSLGAVPQTTVGYEQRFNWAFAITDEDEFVHAVLEGQPPAPRYFAQMKRVNREGPCPVANLPMPEQLPAERLATELDAGTRVVDMRSAEVFAARHVPGTLNLPNTSSFLTWAGWLVSYDRPLALIVDAAGRDNAVRQLRLIGFDSILGFWTPDVIDAWVAAGGVPATIEHADAARAQEIVHQDGAQVLDVRTAEEYATNHIPGSRNIPIQELEERLDEVPQGQPLLVHCQGGARSTIATSLLSGRIDASVVNLVGGFAAWESSGQPVEAPTQTAPSTSRGV